ncbi:MAG: protein translocase subunit SecD [Acidimicrobiia bacterium]
MVSVRRMRTYLVVSVLVVASALGATVASGNEPVLGLDLQGGISVVLAPVGKFKAESLDVALEIIRERVDGLGVAEPEISRQGSNIVVDLPGVKDRNKARRVVGQTAELRFRPVLAELPALGSTVSTTTTTAPASEPTDPTATTSPPVDETTTTTTTTAAAADGSEAARAAVASCDPNQIGALLTAGTEIPNATRADDKRSACVVLPLRDAQGGAPRLLLGPTELTGNGVASARSRFAQGEGYTVSVRFTDKGASAFDALAAASFPKAPPENQVAIVLDGVVQSAPAFQAESFSGDVQITGNFTPTEAEDLATIINYGALPVQLEELTVQNVSPSLGQDQLDAGITAGLIGLLLVALYMIAYYRLLGLVVVVGLIMTYALVYALISYLGSSIGLTLTLAGVTGLIVSVGVTVDSYIVYFERLKDEIRSGRSIRSSVDRGFTRSFRTIVAADVVALIGALVLYFLAIGSVRGFAFFLGLSTILDLAVSYFFMHPMVSLMARRPALVRMRGIGIAAGLDAPEVRA